MDGPDSLIGLIGMLHTDKVKAGHAEGIEELLRKTLSELKGLQSGYQEACESYATLAQSARDLTAKLKTTTPRLYEARISAFSESGDNPAADTNSLAMQLLSLEREVELLQDSMDLMNYVRLPLALDRKQEVTRDLKRAEHLEAALYAALSHAQMQQRLEQAGMFESEGRIVCVSEKTERLKQVAAECYRAAQLSHEDLTSARAARLTHVQQRHASGQTTKAEATFAALELSRSTDTTEGNTE